MRASLFFDEFLFPLDCFRNETQVITYLKVISSPIQIILQAIALIARNPFYRIYPMSIPVYFVNNSYQVQLLKQVLIFFLFWLLWNGNPFLSFEFSHNIEMKLQIAPLNTSELRCLPPCLQNFTVIFFSASRCLVSTVQLQLVNLTPTSMRYTISYACSLRARIRDFLGPSKTVIPF